MFRMLTYETFKLAKFPFLGVSRSDPIDVFGECCDQHVDKKCCDQHPLPISYRKRLDAQN